MSHDVSTDLTVRLHELARISAAPGPVVSVYLNTRWSDEHQRDRVRLFLTHRDQHFEAVVETLTRLIEGDGIQRIVLAGETRAVAVFRPHLPPRLATRVVGAIPAARYEPASALAARAAELVARVDAEEERAAVDAALTEAAKGGRAVASLEEALEAVGRGAVHRLFLLKGFREPGRLCASCGALQRVDGPACRVCGQRTEPRELGEALVERVLAAGGRVDVLDAHDGLARVGGVAALLRYPL